MAAKTEVKITAKGVDKTKGMFSHIRANVAKLGASTKRIALGVGAVGAGIAAGLTAGLVAIRSVSRELSTLSDRAAQIGTTSAELSKLSTAFNVLGVQKSDLESITKGLQKMTQTTGRIGVEGLKATLAEIAKIGDEQQRIQALSDTFGKAFGPGMAALVRQGPEALLAGFDGVLEVMPAVSNELTDRADEIADGFAIAGQGIKTLWQEAWIQIGTSMTDNLGLSARETAGVFVAQFNYLVKAAFLHVKTFVHNAIEFFKNFPTNIGIMLNYVRDNWKDIFKSIWVYIREWTTMVLKQIGNLAGMIWRVLKSPFTDESTADIFAEFTETAEKTWRTMKENIEKDAPKLPPLHLEGDWQEVDLEPLRKQRDAAIEKVMDLERDIKQVAAGVAPAIEDGLDPEETGKKIGRSISNEMKRSNWITAGSNALRNVMLATGKKITATEHARTSRTVTDATKAVAKESKERNAILERLKELIAVQQGGWDGVGKALGALGVV